MKRLSSAILLAVAAAASQAFATQPTHEAPFHMGDFIPTSNWGAQPEHKPRRFKQNQRKQRRGR